MLIKKGAEADIYLVKWYGRKAILKVRPSRKYRNRILDQEIRMKRTFHEAEMISSARRASVPTPLIYFVNTRDAQIIMEYVEGELARDLLSSDLDICSEIGKYAALLHKNNIVHGDLTTSNFIVCDGKLALIDFGLSYFSDRVEDKAVDIRLIKEIMGSAHSSIYKEAFVHFMKGYQMIAGKPQTTKIVSQVTEIERRGRYARVV